MAAPQLADLVLENSNAPGTGPIVLGGAPEGRQTFADAFPAGGEVYYYASDGQQTEWGVGTLTVGSPNTLARTTVLGNLFGTKTVLNFTQNITVWCEVPAVKSPALDDAGYLPVKPAPDFTQDVALGAKDAAANFLRLAGALQKIAGAVEFDGEVAVPNPADIPGKSTGNHAASTYWTDNNFLKLIGGNTVQGDQVFKDLQILLQNSGLTINGSFECNGPSTIGKTGGTAAAYDSTAQTNILFGTGSRLGYQADDSLVLYDAAGAVLAVDRKRFNWNGQSVATQNQLPFSDTTQKIQAFTFTSAGVSPNDAGVFVPFQTAFKAGTVPVVIITGNKESVGGQFDRSFDLANIDHPTNKPNITNEGFYFNPIYLASNNINFSPSQLVLQVIAIGVYA